MDLIPHDIPAAEDLMDGNLHPDVQQRLEQNIAALRSADTPSEDNGGEDVVRP